jgi:hypothetical protein
MIRDPSDRKSKRSEEANKGNRVYKVDKTNNRHLFVHKPAPISPNRIMRFIEKPKKSSHGISFTNFHIPTPSSPKVTTHTSESPNAASHNLITYHTQMISINPNTE